MKAGKLDIGSKLILAPMAEITDSAFRKICRDYGAGLTFTQMVSADGVIKNNFNTLRYLVFSRQEKPIGVQVLGREPEIIKNAVNELISFQPDVIDLNGGCPASKVCKFDMGAKLLDDTFQLGKIVNTMVKAAGNIPVSVKLRLGKSNKKINIIENAKVCEDNGASFIIVHARTREDKYSSQPLMHWVGEVKQKIKIPVVVNGSLFEPAEIVNVLKDTGADSAMIARGALGNPFIFSRFNAICETGTDPGSPSLQEIKSACIKHTEYCTSEMEETAAINKMKKHIIWYFKEYKGIEFLMDKIFSVKTFNVLIELIDEHINNIDNEFYKNDTTEDFRRKFNEKVIFWSDN